MPYIYKSGLQFGINETNIYGGLNCVELTQAEYDELTYEQKHNGQVYFITDGNYDYIIVNDSVPIGAIQAYGGITAPDGWLICDGRAVSRTEYYELFKVIGVSYGTGDGTTTFNLPDLSVTNYIIKAKNLKATKGQTDLFYPVGAYFETSDINFNPNEAWGGTWILKAKTTEEESLLYNGSFTTGTASLTDGINNYYKIKIIANDNDNTLKTFEIMNEKANSFSTYLDFGRIAGGWYAKCMVVTFNGSSMTENYNKQAYFSTITAEGTYVTVKKVYGYKQIVLYEWHRTA